MGTRINTCHTRPENLFNRFNGERLVVPRGHDHTRCSEVIHMSNLDFFQAKDEMQEIRRWDFTVVRSEGSGMRIGAVLNFDSVE